MTLSMSSGMGTPMHSPYAAGLATHAGEAHAATGITAYAWLLVALPAFGALLLLVGGRRTNSFGPVLATAKDIRINTLSKAGRPVPLSRQGFFLAGLIVLMVAYVSPLEGLADELLTYHMIQHLLIMDVAALLFVLGLTGPVMQPGRPHS